MKILIHFAIYTVVLTTWVISEVPMIKHSTWTQNGLMKTHAYCTFNITERQRKGQWKMTLTTNKPTKWIKLWIMKVTERSEDKKTYTMKSKYEYWPQKIDVQFRLTYKKGGPPLTGSCLSNVEPTPDEEEAEAEIVASNTIQYEHDWKDGEGRIMQGKCVLPLTKSLDDFYLALNFDQRTDSLKNWIGKDFSKDPHGRWYIIKNKWPAHAPELHFIFHVYYNSDKPPTGQCAILVGDEPKPPTPQSTVAPNPPSEDTTTSDITVENTYNDNGGMKMQGRCKLPIDMMLQSFYILIELSKDTENLEIWIGREEVSEPNGRWYLVKNYHDGHPPELNFPFGVKYTGNEVPSGVCKLYSETLDPIILRPTTAALTTTTTSTTPEPTTTIATTPKPTSNAPTARSSTTQSMTHSKSTQQTTTLAPTTQETTNKPTDASTTSFTEQKSTTQSPTNTPVSTKYDYAEVIELSILFYEAQRSGKLPANNRIAYRDDSALNDKGFYGEDLSGGWYDAGDGVKFNLPMASSVTLLSWGLTEWKDAYTAAGQLEYMYDSIKWPLDYLLKCWNEDKDTYYCQVADGGVDHAFWGRPEEMTYKREAFAVDTTKPGSDVAGETAAALAIGSIVFELKGDSTYSSELLSKAKTMYSFAKTYRGKYSDSVSQANPFYTSRNGYEDELCLAAIMLYKATGNDVYLNEAKGFVSTSTAWSLSWDEKTVACQLILYQETMEQTYKNPVESFLNDYLTGNVPETPCGLAFRLQWGSNRYAANAALVALMAADTDGFSRADDYKTWAMQQIHYMLGDNNYDMSYLIGFGNKYPKKPHHRAASCPDMPASCTDAQLYSSADNPQTLLGALVGGPDIQDNYADDRTDYVKNEVTTDYNAGFQSAVAGLLHFALDNDLPPAPAPKC